MVTKEELRIWFSERLGDIITDKTVFFDRLGIAGLDADVLMDEFFTDFEIDCSDFRYEKYFPWGIHAIKNIFMLRRAWECDLEHLHNVVVAKKWFDPERYSKTK